MTNNGLIPKWVTVIVISKDMIVIAGSLILYFVTNKLTVEPTLLGKVSSAGQFILIGLVLLMRNINDGISVPAALFFIVAVLTTLSGLQYVYNGLKISNTVNSD
jgi:cardiolipin synthase